MEKPQNFTKLVFAPFYESTRKQLLLLVFIVLLGAILRFTGINWGLPYQLHPDEGAITRDAYKIAANQENQPQIYDRPDHTNIKIIAFIYQIADAFIEGSIADNYSDNITIYYTVARSVSAFIGVLSILLSFMIASKFSKASGCIAAGLFAFSSAFVGHAHYITPEILQTFCLMAVTYFMLLYWESEKLSILILACVFLALAFCEKYPSITYALVIGIGIMLTHNIIKKPKDVIRRWFQAAFFFIFSVVIISLNLVLEYTNVLAALERENRTNHLGADGLSFWGNLSYYIQTYISHFGWIISILSVFGLFMYLKISKPKSIILYSGIIYMVPLAFTHLHWERWGVPFYANMLIIAAVGAAGIYDMIRVKTQKLSKQLSIAVKSISVAVLFGIPGLSLFVTSLTTAAGFVAKDTRVITQDIVKQFDMNKENTFFEGYTPLNPTGPATIFDKFKDFNFDAPKNINYKNVILSSSMYGRFYAEPKKYSSEIAFYDSIIKSDYVFSKVTPYHGKGGSRFELINIKNKISDFFGYVKGGNSGPTLVFALIPFQINYRTYETDMLAYLDLITTAEYNDCTVFFSVKDEAVKNLGDDLRDKLAAMGFLSIFSEEAYQKSFIGIWQAGEVVYEQQSKGTDNKETDLLIYEHRMPNGAVATLKSAGWKSGNISSIMIDGIECSKNRRGFNIVVYDNQTGEFIDSINWDTFSESGINGVR